ncbi:LexA family protein [uncultured Sphingomonas sp.]|uniref:LexA family protein n=1 Tax=uncultured Sphingomonas sp. TaxID=158754 RepID=UPI003749E0E8
MSAPCIATSQARRYQVLAFITDVLVQQGRSPSIREIGAAFSISDTRVKQLVHRLAQEQLILRQPGAQRGISVPGLSRQMQIDRAKALLRDAGVRVDEDFAPSARPFPQGQLHIVAVLEHTPDPEPGDSGQGDDHDCGDGTAAGGAPGAGRAAAEADGDRPA